MIGRLLAAAAFAAAVTGTALIGTAGAQMSAPPPANPTASPSATGTSPATAAPHKPAMSQHSATRGTSVSPAKQTAQGHEQNNVADKLNACEAKPAAERRSCLDAATRM